MAPHTTNGSLTNNTPYPFPPLASSGSPSSSETITTIVFGLSALIIGVITIKQSRNAWKIWHAHSQYAPTAQDHVNPGPDLELGNITPAPIAAPEPEPEQSPLEQVDPPLTSPHSTKVGHNVDNPFEQLHESSSNSMSTETLDVTPLDSSTISTESSHKNAGGPATLGEAAPTLMMHPPAGGRAVT